MVGTASQRRKHPDPASYFGKGRAAELVDERAATGFNLLIVDDELAPNQQRALEKLLDCKVLDRSALIIDIFARHASTRDGRLQVELAALEYHLPRLTRLWTHLSRTGGGIGTRGPGESQLETDRRLIRDKIKKVRGELEDVKRQRATAARPPKRTAEPTTHMAACTHAAKRHMPNRRPRLPRRRPAARVRRRRRGRGRVDVRGLLAPAVYEDLGSVDVARER